MRWYTKLLILFFSLFCFGAGVYWERGKSKPDLESKIYRQSEVKKAGGSWGSIYIYTNDSTTTYGTSSMLSAVLEFLPGKKLQAPHQHDEEEFQFIIDGGGTWTLNGVESTIKKGDLMYARPGDIHGISNTGSDTLKFFVVKWKNKGVPSHGKK